VGETLVAPPRDCKSVGTFPMSCLARHPVLGGRDIVSYPYFTDKKSWMISSKKIDITALESYAEDPASIGITTDVLRQAKALCVKVYTIKNDDFTNSGLDELRACKFLNDRSTLLKLLPPTEDSFLQHVRRAALATLVDKSAHISKPNIPAHTDYGWTLDGDKLLPIPSTKSAWPEQRTNAISCGCTKGCQRNCSCAKKEIACYIGCRCHGDDDKCSRVKYTTILSESDSTSSSDSDDNDD
jgi:hypothetical protein